RHRRLARRGGEASRKRARAARAVDQARRGARGRDCGRCGARHPVARRRSPSRTRRRRQMIRVVIFLVAVAVVAFGVVWLADRPGEVVITWPWLDQAWPRLGGDLRTGLGVALIAIMVIALATSLLIWLCLAIWRSPGNVAFFLRHRRSARGYQAISRGLIAIGAGGLQAAPRLSTEARPHA